MPRPETLALAAPAPAPGAKKVGALGRAHLPLSSFKDGPPVFSSSGRKLGGFAAESVRRAAYYLGLYGPDSGGGHTVAADQGAGGPANLTALPGAAGGKAGGKKAGGGKGGAGKKAAGGAAKKAGGGAAKKAGGAGGKGKAAALPKATRATRLAGARGLGASARLHGLAVPIARPGGQGGGAGGPGHPAGALPFTPVGKEAAAQARTDAAARRKAAAAAQHAAAPTPEERQAQAREHQAATAAMRALASADEGEYHRKLDATGWHDAASPQGGFADLAAATHQANTLGAARPDTMFAVVAVGDHYYIAAHDRASLRGAAAAANVAAPGAGTQTARQAASVATATQQRTAAIQQHDQARAAHDAAVQGRLAQYQQQGGARGGFQAQQGQQGGGTPTSVAGGAAQPGQQGAAVGRGQVDNSGFRDKSAADIAKAYGLAAPDQSHLTAQGQAVIARRQATIQRRAAGLADAIRRAGLDPKSPEALALQDHLATVAAMSAVGSIDSNAVSLNVAQEARQLLRDALANQREAQLAATSAGAGARGLPAAPPAARRRTTTAGYLAGPRPR